MTDPFDPHFRVKPAAYVSLDDESEDDSNNEEGVAEEISVVAERREAVSPRDPVRAPKTWRGDRDETRAATRKDSAQKKKAASEEVSPREKALSLALNRLDRREHAAGELISHLKRKGIEEQLAQEVVGRFVERGIIDDQRYSRILTRMQVLRGKGARFIQLKLREKGVRLELGQVQALVDEVSEVPEIENARRLLERRYPNAKQDRAERSKAFQTLVRRGFSFDLARRAIESMGAEIDGFPESGPEELEE